MIRYVDGTYDMVVSQRLDGLIKAGKVLEFRRGGGWARIGRDPVRKGRAAHPGEDRRKGEAEEGQMLH
jgi:hypothetical protein